MRIRSTKPEFYKSSDITALTYFNRFLFQALWSYVDDNGVGLDRVSLVIGELFPDDMVRDPRDTLARVSEGLQTLADAGLIERYEVGGKRYLHVVTWERHQRIDKPNKPRYPLPTCEDATIRDTLPTPSRHSRETPAPGTEEQRNRGTEEQNTNTPTPADADDASETGASAEPPATPDPTDTPTNPQPPKQKTPKKTNPNATLEGFDDWWAAYPRKTSKQAARRAYATALKNGATPARLLEGLTAALPGLSEREARFVPYPATWLNGGAWEDEPAAAPGSVRVARRGTALAREGVVCDDMRTYRGWLSPQPVSRDGVVIHDPLGSLGPPVVGGDHDWWAEQGVPAVAAS